LALAAAAKDKKERKGKEESPGREENNRSTLKGKINEAIRGIKTRITR
jgi:hypothetical protein